MTFSGKYVFIKRLETAYETLRKRSDNGLWVRDLEINANALY